MLRRGGMKDPSDRLLLLRFLLASCAGGAAWVAFPPVDNPMEQTYAALLAGFGAAWLVGNLARRAFKGWLE